MKIAYRSSITVVIGVLLLILFGCKKEVIIPPLPQEESIRFEITPFVNDATYEFQSDSISLNINVTSAVPSAGINYSIKVTRTDNSLLIFERETSSLLSSIQLKLGKFEINKTYSIDIKAVSKSKADNQSSKTYSAKRKRVYKNYLKTSYELSNYESWFSTDDLYENGARYTRWTPLKEQQTCQVDINGDGLEDIVYYEAYLLDIPLTNPPPRIFMNNGKILEAVQWTGPSILNPHGSKLLVGDYNCDTLPDVLACVAIDGQERNIGGLDQISHILINSNEGLTTVKEITEQLGFHHTGCSGDIDNDGDLDIIMMNFAFFNNGVTSKILWNDGKGNFTFKTSGFSNVAPIVLSELFDVNYDGFLDLVVARVNSHLDQNKEIIIMWGNGKDFGLSNSTSFEYPMNCYLWDIDFTDVDNDRIAEILLSLENVVDVLPNKRYFVDLYKSNDIGKTYNTVTNQYFDNIYVSYLNKMIVRDLEKNGKIDIYTADKKDNIRWEWNGSKFIRQ